MKLVIVTGMSGAGKSIALKILEDLGYFCVDNLPIQLMPKFAEILTTPNSELKQVALGIDVRSGQALDGLEEQLNAMDKAGIDYEILFLDAQDDVLVKRYKETRRQHPLGGAGHIDVGIAKEREKISFLKMRATYILDTSKMLTRELKKELEQIFVDGKNFKNLYITVMSFGFKYGIPQDADLVASGCTGGKHRSVTVANALYQVVKQDENYGVRIEHRDIEKDAITKAK